MEQSTATQRVMVTGATGFVGRMVVRQLLAGGFTPVCLVRSSQTLLRQQADVSPERLVSVVGSLRDVGAVNEAVEGAHAVIHLVGIILQRRLQGQTFHRIHVEGTRKIVEAAQRAGVRRFIYMSALGTRPHAASAYHRTKWIAEEIVRSSGLDWTIFRPSLIHGPQGELMRLLKRFSCNVMPPVIPYFGNGQARLQPVFVKDVAICVVESLKKPETVRQVFPLGGPKAYSWKELYNACRAWMPGAKHWKPMVSQPVPVAKAIAWLGGPVMAVAEWVIPPLGLFRFDSGQVQMSQEDATCDHTLAEHAFGITMRNFEEELAVYASQIS
ncbi:MAG: NAD(P)H-binding protein [Planctomycetota bacterium]